MIVENSLGNSSVTIDIVVEDLVSTKVNALNISTEEIVLLNSTVHVNTHVSFKIEM